MTISDPLPDWLWTLAGRDPGRKAYRRGTHRVLDPSETLRKVLPRLPEMGITRVANVTGLDCIGIPVVMVCRPNSRSLAVTQGKGFTLDAAKASGIMEAVEHYQAERVDQPLRLAREEELRSAHPVIDVSGLACVAGSTGGTDRRTLWIEGFDLLQETPRWLPYETVHADYTLPLPPRRVELLATTNGLASGNTLLEAVSHGLCEVIERDGTSRWQRCGDAELGERRLDLETVDDAACTNVLDRLAAAGFSVAAWNTTTDLGVPSFYALIRDEARPNAHSGTGAGCHPCRSIALLRALLEAVQVRTTYISGARDDLSHAEFTPEVMRSRHDEERRLLDAAPPRARFGDIAEVEHETFAEDLGFLLGRLRAVGVSQAVMVDLSGALSDLAVARVVVPGLENPDDEAEPIGVAGQPPASPARARA